MLIKKHRVSTTHLKRVDVQLNSNRFVPVSCLWVWLSQSVMAARSSLLFVYHVGICRPRSNGTLCYPDRLGLPRVRNLSLVSEKRAR